MKAFEAAAIGNALGRSSRRLPDRLVGPLWIAVRLGPGNAFVMSQAFSAKEPTLFPVSGVDHSNIRIIVATFFFGDEPAYLFVAEKPFDFAALLDEKRPETPPQG